MGSSTKIEWTDATWNPTRGCTRISSGCKNCFAERMAARFAGPGQPYEGVVTGGRWSGEVRLIEAHLDDPLHWRRPRRIFVNSMSDLFHEALPEDEIARVFAVMALAKQHVYQVLTKRPKRMLALLSSPVFWRVVDYAACELMDDPCGTLGNVKLLRNVWIGVSVENQNAADERIPLLLKTPAAVRWISAEPLLGPLDVDPWIGCTCSNPQGCSGVAGGGCPGLNWVVVGAESGPGARPMDLIWAQWLVDQCQESGTPVFVKQLGRGFRHRKGGDPTEWPTSLQVREWPYGYSPGTEAICRSDSWYCSTCGETGNGCYCIFDADPYGILNDA